MKPPLEALIDEFDKKIDECVLPDLKAEQNAKWVEAMDYDKIKLLKSFILEAHALGKEEGIEEERERVIKAIKNERKTWYRAKIGQAAIDSILIILADSGKMKTTQLAGIFQKKI